MNFYYNSYFIDIDECKLNATCEQDCYNTERSYFCGCNDGGYDMKMNGYNCTSMKSTCIHIYLHINANMYILQALMTYFSQSQNVVVQ